MNGLTSPCHVNFPGVSVFPEGGRQPHFRAQCCGVSISKHRQMTSWVSILADPSFTEAAGGSAHLEPSQANQPTSCKPFVWPLLPGYGTYLDAVTLATDEGCLSQANLWLWWVYFRHHSELSSNRTVPVWKWKDQCFHHQCFGEDETSPKRICFSH